MALTNCSINKFTTVVTQGAELDSQYLLITPDIGFVISKDAINGLGGITNNTGSVTGINTITLSNTTTANAADNQVKVLVDFSNTYDMPGANTTFTLDLDGSATVPGISFSPRLLRGLVEDGEGFTSHGDYSTTVTNSSGSTISISQSEGYNQYLFGDFVGENGVATFIGTIKIEVGNNTTSIVNSAFLYSPSLAWNIGLNNFELQLIETFNHTDSDGGIKGMLYNVYFTPTENFENNLLHSSSWYNVNLERRLTTIPEIDHIELGGGTIGGASSDEIPTTGGEVELIVTGDIGSTFTITGTAQSNSSTVLPSTPTLAGTTYEITHSAEDILLSVPPKKGTKVFKLNVPVKTSGEDWNITLTGTSGTTVANTAKISDKEGSTGNTITSNSNNNANGIVLNKLRQFANPTITLAATVVGNPATDSIALSGTRAVTGKPNKTNSELSRTYGLTSYPESFNYSMVITTSGGRNYNSVANTALTTSNFTASGGVGHRINKITGSCAKTSANVITVTGTIEVDTYGTGNQVLTVKLGTDGLNLVTWANS
jgi:hypothetical protein|tara:strand:+ start:3528 stop:5159 length:1632 start_codon:yes stop_codon:yes gene_type:complete